jgi:hypothetical protein
MTLKAVRERFGDKISLQIMDRRRFREQRELEGWQHLDVLRSEGNYEQIRERLHKALERHRSAGRINEDAYRQSIGQAPGPKNQGVDSSAGGWYEDTRHGRGRTPENRQEDLLKPALTTEKTPDLWPDSKLATDELQQRGRERWLEYRRKHGSDQESESEQEVGAKKDPEKSEVPGTSPGSGIDDDFGQ